MIVYKRRLKREDLENLAADEELIYYKSDDVAITINLVGDQFIVRWKEISNNEMLRESLVKDVDEMMDYIPW